MTPRVVLVAAVADNAVIGNAGGIPWRLPGEQAQFKALTMGHVLLMGRSTYDSIGRPLPGRTTIVLTRDVTWSAAGVLVAHSMTQALAIARDLDDGDVMVVGGAQVYAEALPVADAQVLSKVPLSPVGDTYYPSYDAVDWEETRRETFEGYDRVWLQRRPPTQRADS